MATPVVIEHEEAASTLDSWEDCTKHIEYENELLELDIDDIDLPTALLLLSRLRSVNNKLKQDSPLSSELERRVRRLRWQVNNFSQEVTNRLTVAELEEAKYAIEEERKAIFAPGARYVDLLFVQRMDREELRQLQWDLIHAWVKIHRQLRRSRPGYTKEAELEAYLAIAVIRIALPCFQITWEWEMSDHEEWYFEHVQAAIRDKILSRLKNKQGRFEAGEEEELTALLKDFPHRPEFLYRAHLDRDVENLTYEPEDEDEDENEDDDSYSGWGWVWNWYEEWDDYKVDWSLEDSEEDWAADNKYDKEDAILALYPAIPRESLADDEQECPVCGEEYGVEFDKDVCHARASSCCRPAKIGSNCLLMWFGESGKETCPICRKNLQADISSVSSNRSPMMELPSLEL